MDKKNTTLGILLILAAIGVMIYTQRHAPEPTRRPAPAVVDDGATPAGPPPAETISSASGSVERPAARSTAPAPIPPWRTNTLFTSVEEDGRIADPLRNDHVAVFLSARGGGIAEVEMREVREGNLVYPAAKRSSKNPDPLPYVINRAGHRTEPALSLYGIDGADPTLIFAVLPRTDANRLSVQATTADGRLRITRTYTLNTKPAVPYLIRHVTRIENLTGDAIATDTLHWSLGTAEPVGQAVFGALPNVGIYNGDDSTFNDTSVFKPGFFSKIFGGGGVEQALIERAEPAVWGSVKNQFFTTILTPATPGTAVLAKRVRLAGAAGSDPDSHVGITGWMRADPVRVEANGSTELEADFYAGPKEYFRLERLGHSESEVMDFGWFAFFSKVLLMFLVKLHSLFAASDWAWGWSIIMATLIIRTSLWPITASAARSAKRMAKISAPMKALQEKYKDNRAKLNEEMIKLFKEHKVNPAGSCLPLLIQFPIFLGFFRMLGTASELRFAEFLWIGDLSAPDTVAEIPFPFIGSLPINPMPLLMGASMVVQMRMTPTPTTDNASAKMMKFMPYMVTAFCYNYSSGLAVYWTATNLFSIFQQWVTNRRKDPALEATASPGKPAPAPVRQPARSLPAGKKKRK